MPEEQQAPEVLALILAESAYRDEVTGKYFILGTFSVIAGLKFPWTHPVLTVYAAITDGRGTTRLKFRLVDVDEVREPVFSLEFDLEIADPLLVYEVAIRCPNLVFPEAGEYRLQLYGGGEFLLERRVQVLHLDNPDGPEPGEGELP